MPTASTGFADDGTVFLATLAAGVHRSVDGGLTWTVPAGLEAFSEMRHLLVLPDGNQTILLHGRAGVGQFGATRTALFASTDLGQTFQERWSSPTNWKGDVWVPRFGPGAGTDVYVLQGGKLLAQFQDVLCPITLGVEPREAQRKRRVVPAPRQPGAVMQNTQCTQGLNQRQLRHVELAEFFIAFKNFK